MLEVVKKDKIFKNDLPLNINLQLFADGGNGDTGQNGGDDSNNGGNDKTFTQAELDNIVKGRISETKKATQKSLLEELGLEKIDDLKVIVQAKKEADNKNKSDLEKLQEQIINLTKEKETATAKAKQSLMIADFKVKAVAQGLNDKQMEATLKLADMSGVEVKDDGTIDGTEEVIKNVLETYPFLKGAPNNNVGGGAGSNPGGDDDKGGTSSIGQRLANARKAQREQTAKQNPYFK